MLHASTQKLIIKLHELTESGAIAWKDAAGHRSLFETEGYRVEIESHPPGVYLLDMDGKELEHATEAELAAVAWPDGNGTFALRVTDMARRAKRVARGTDHAISRILSSLSAPPRNGEPAASGFEQPPPPPAPHSMPDAAPEPETAEADTAIERVLAVQPLLTKPLETQPPEPEPAAIETEPLVETAPAEPETEATQLEEEAAEALEPIAENAGTDPVAVIAGIESEPPASEPIVEAVTVEPDAPSAKTSFGATQSFDRGAAPATPKAVAPQPAAKPYAPSLLFTGISARTHQTTRGEPAAPPKPAPQVQHVVEKAPERELAPASTGSDIYKPWA